MAEQESGPEDSLGERRTRQRFVARREGSVCFWVLIDGERLPLNDLSVEGFGLPFEAPPEAPRPFAFVLQIDGAADEIRGEARPVNFVRGQEGVQGGGQLGCRFVSFAADGAERLQAWLTAHLLGTASVPISDREAAAIVVGPSLI